LLLVLGPRREVLVKWQQVAGGGVRADEEAVLADEVRSGAGRAQGEVDLGVVVALAGVDGVELERDV